MITKNTFIKDFGLENLEQEDQNKILNKITEVVLKRVLVGVLENLSDTEKIDFEGLQENSSPEEINFFLISKIANYEEMVQKIIFDFEKEIKKSIDTLTSI